MKNIKSLVHDHCSHKTGYIVQWHDTEEKPGGWTWHRTVDGALRSQHENGGHIFKILSDDYSVRVA